MRGSCDELAQELEAFRKRAVGDAQLLISGYNPNPDEEEQRQVDEGRHPDIGGPTLDAALKRIGVVLGTQDLRIDTTQISDTPSL